MFDFSLQWDVCSGRTETAVSYAVKFCTTKSRSSWIIHVRPHLGPLASLSQCLLLWERHLDLYSLHTRLFALPRLLCLCLPSGTHEPLPPPPHRCPFLTSAMHRQPRTAKWNRGNHGVRLVNLSNLGFPNDILHISGSLKHTTTTLDNITAATALARHENENYLQHTSDR